VTLRRPALLLLLVLLLSARARADGGHIAFHGTSGPTTVTVFSAPEPLVPGPADFSVLLQNAEAGDPVAGAVLHGTLTHGALSEPVTFAPSGSLLAASLKLPEAGHYLLRLEVARPDAPGASFTISLNVQPPGSRFLTLVVALAAPLAIVVLFLINQWLKELRRVPRVRPE
jgi:hypothetical protein